MDTIDPNSRQPQARNHSRRTKSSRRRRLSHGSLATTAAVLALGLSASIAAVATEEQIEVLGVDDLLGESRATARSDPQFERMLFDMAADLPLDHAPAIPIQRT